MEDYSDGFKSLIFSGAPQSRTGTALDWCTDVRARNDDDFFDFPRQRQFGSFGLPQLMWAGRIYCGDERYPGHRTIFGSKQINNNILHSVFGHMHLRTSLRLAGRVAGGDFPPTLYRIDIVRWVDHYFSLFLGPTLLPSLAVYIALALRNRIEATIYINSRHQL